MNSGHPQKLVRQLEKLKADNQELKHQLAVLKKENQLSLQAALQSRELLMRTPVSLLLIQKGTIILANQAAYDQLGYTEDEILNQSFLDLVHPDSRERVSRLYHRMISGRSVPVEFEASLTRKNGERLLCDVRAKKSNFQGRRAFLFSIIGIDHWIKKEIRSSREKKTEALLRMASGINHLFTDCMRLLSEDAVPIQNIEPISDAGFSKYRACIESTREKGNIILETLATLTQGEPIRSDSLPFDLKKIVQNALASTLPKRKETFENGKPKIKVKTYLRNLAPVKGNPGKIQNVFVNMISNAVEALPDGGEIYLTTEAAAGFAHVYVQDNGVGIPVEIEDKIFDPFFTTKKRNHPGLGLSLARAVIHQHQGKIEVISNEGQGTTFAIKIPLAPVLPTRKAKYPRNRIKDSHILIISDEGIFKDLLFQLFLGKGGNVSSSANGTEALKLMKKKNFDLVVIDLGLTYLESSRIISRIRKMERAVPIALINPEERADTPHTLDKLGADLVIGRPLEMDKILSLVSQAFVMRSASK